MESPVDNPVQIQRVAPPFSEWQAETSIVLVLIKTGDPLESSLIPT